MLPLQSKPRRDGRLWLSAPVCCGVAARQGYRIVFARADRLCLRTSRWHSRCWPGYPADSPRGNTPAAVTACLAVGHDPRCLLVAVRPLGQQTVRR